jgi:hypothetical protein
VKKMGEKFNVQPKVPTNGATYSRLVPSNSTIPVMGKDPIGSSKVVPLYWLVIGPCLFL